VCILYVHGEDFGLGGFEPNDDMISAVHFATVPTISVSTTVLGTDAADVAGRLVNC
jgi:hypothetical protein